MRIASLAPSVTIMLQELGVADKIVACTSLCPLPAAERRDKAVGSFSVLNKEKIALAKPDLVVTATLVQAKGAKRLRQAGFSVLHLDPRRLTDVAETYRTLGQHVERGNEGRALQQRFLEELAAVSPAAPGRRPRVYMEEWHEPPFVAGNWVPDLVAAAGGEAVLIQPGEASRESTLNEIEAADPDMLIQHVCLPPLWLQTDPEAATKRTRQREVMRQRLLTRPGWERLQAVKTGHVYAIDDTPFNMPTRGVLQGIGLLKTAFAQERIPT